MGPTCWRWLDAWLLFVGFLWGRVGCSASSTPSSFLGSSAWRLSERGITFKARMRIVFAGFDFSGDEQMRADFDAFARNAEAALSEAFSDVGFAAASSNNAYTDKGFRRTERNVEPIRASASVDYNVSRKILVRGTETFDALERAVGRSLILRREGVYDVPRTREIDRAFSDFIEGTVGRPSAHELTLVVFMLHKSNMAKEAAIGNDFEYQYLGANRARTNLWSTSRRCAIVDAAALPVAYGSRIPGSSAVVPREFTPFGSLGMVQLIRYVESALRHVLLPSPAFPESMLPSRVRIRPVWLAPQEPLDSPLLKRLMEEAWRVGKGALIRAVGAPPLIGSSKEVKLARAAVEEASRGGLAVSSWTLHRRLMALPSISKADQEVHIFFLPISTKAGDPCDDLRVFETGLPVAAFADAILAFVPPSENLPGCTFELPFFADDARITYSRSSLLNHLTGAVLEVLGSVSPLHLHASPDRSLERVDYLWSHGDHGLPPFGGTFREDSSSAAISDSAMDAVLRNAVARHANAALHTLSRAAADVRTLLQAHLYDPYHVHESKELGRSGDAGISNLDWLDHVCAQEDDMGLHRIAPKLVTLLAEFYKEYIGLLARLQDVQSHVTAGDYRGLILQTRRILQEADAIASRLKLSVAAEARAVEAACDVAYINRRPHYEMWQLASGAIFVIAVMLAFFKNYLILGPGRRRRNADLKGLSALFAKRTKREKWE